MLTVRPPQSQRAEASNPALQSLSSNAQAAFDHYQALFRRTSRAPRFFVELSGKEYAEVQDALECDPSLCAFVRTSVCSKWTFTGNSTTKQTLYILMPTEVHEHVVIGVRKDLLAQLETLRDTASSTGELSRLAQRVELVESERKVKLLKVRSTSTGPTLNRMKFLPDASFIFEGRKKPILVIEVGYSEDKSSMHSKAMSYLQTPMDMDYIKTVISINLPYQEPEDRKRRNDPLPIEGTCTVYRATRANGKLTIDIQRKKFMKKDRSPARDKSLDLRLSDFCMPGLCTDEFDIPISISSQDLVDFFEDGITSQLEVDAADADEDKLIEEAQRALDEGRKAPQLDDYDTVCTGDPMSPATSEASETESDDPASSDSDETFQP